MNCIAAKEFVRSLGVTHRILHTEELASEAFVRNSPDRCYYCKKELFEKLRKLADTEGISFVIEGSNTDDLKDHRPGRKAAQEYAVRSPLVEAGLSKSEVRELARSLGPACLGQTVACLPFLPHPLWHTDHTCDTPGPYRQPRTICALTVFGRCACGTTGTRRGSRLTGPDFPKLLSSGVAERITAALKEIGYTYVCLDLAGYRTGSMNEGMKQECRSQRSSGRE